MASTLGRNRMRFLTCPASLASAYGRRPHEWNLPGPDFEKKVFGPMPYDEVKEFVRGKESSGWEIVGYERARQLRRSQEDPRRHDHNRDKPR